MKTYCLVCRENTDNINSKVIKLKMIDYYCCHNVLCVKIKNQDLLQRMNKKQKDY